jgi:hypothetical protein
MTVEDYQEWKKDILCYDEDSHKLITKEERLAMARESYEKYQVHSSPNTIPDVITDEQIEAHIEEELDEFPQTYSDYKAIAGDYETDTNQFTTPGGEEIIVLCYYGYN